MYWTEENLMEAETANRNQLAFELPVGVRPCIEIQIELYRLARLGLAAEQVGRETFTWGSCGLCGNVNKRVSTFLHHEAWRK